MFNKAIKISRTALEGATFVRVLSPTKKAKWVSERFQDMGPTYVKLGQFLSSRADVVSPELIEAFKSLQDSSNPLPWEDVDRVIQSNKLGLSIKDIDEKPIASASIGQVHRGVLMDGTQVVIKVRRPGIVDDIKKDLEILQWLTLLLDNVKGEETRSVLADIKRMILNETDFEREVRNMKCMKDVYPDILIPEAFTDMCSQDIIVMKYVPSTKFSMITKPKAELAYTIMDTFIEQFLQHGLIHGDPHEGNVAMSSFDENVIVMYDLGHVVRLDASTRSLMKVLVFEMMLENVDGVVDVMESMPDIITIIDKTRIKKFVRKYIDYIKTIDVQLLSSLDSRDGSLPLKFSSTVFEIVRVFGIIEGVCLSLDPDFEYNKVFYKYVDRLVLDRDFLEYKAGKDLEKLFKWIT